MLSLKSSIKLFSSPISKPCTRATSAVPSRSLHQSSRIDAQDPRRSQYSSSVAQRISESVNRQKEGKITMDEYRQEVGRHVTDVRKEMAGKMAGVETITVKRPENIKVEKQE